MNPSLGDRSQYEILLRHALAIGGIAASGLSFLDPASGRLTPFAHAESTDPELNLRVERLGREHLGFALSLLTCPEQQTAFVTRAFASEPLIVEQIEVAASGMFDPELVKALQSELGLTHLLAERVMAPDVPPALVVFAATSLPGEMNLKLVDEIAVRLCRLVDSSASRPESGRNRIRQRLDAVLDLAESTLQDDGDLDRVLQRVVDSLLASLGADVTTIVLFEDGDERRLIPRAGALSEEAKAASIGSRLYRPWPVDQGLTGWVARTLQPAISTDVLRDPRSSPRSGRPSESVIAAPLVVAGKAVGVLRAGSSKLGYFSEADVHLIELLARQCAIAIAQARVLQTTRQQNDQLALFARVVEASQDAMVIADSSGQILHCNAATYSLYGYAPGELDGRMAMELTPPEEAGVGVLIQQGLGDAGEWSDEVMQIRKDGSQFPAELSVSVVRDDAKRVIGTIGVVRDLTQRKRHEAQLLQAEKLRSLGVLSSGVAHQINNVLASVLGQAELLLDRTTDPIVRGKLEMIIKSSEDGANAVRRIQEFAQAKPTREFVAVEITAIVNDVIEATAPRWRDQAQRQGRSITVVAVASEPVYVQGDPSELREALSNLVLNAVDAIPASGTIEISVAAARGGKIVIRVHDDGVGMTDQILQRVFDPFFSTKPFGTGVGLGLSLTHGIIQRHGGTITASSKLGKGATFELVFPRIEPPSAPAEPAVDGKTLLLRVLVVDDDPDLADQLQLILSIGGHTVRVCSGGAEALDVLEHESFDLVITDLGMPGVGGWEVAREAKRRDPKTLVALLTGWASELGPDELVERGLDFVVTKPYRIQAIHDLVVEASQAISKREVR